MTILKADPDDAEQLTELTMRSKAHWGYSESQMEKWRDELTISREYFGMHTVYKLIGEAGILGFYAFKTDEQNTIRLDSLFIEPEFIGRGFGSMLLEDFLGRVQNEKEVLVTLEADPNAAGFYLDKGFQITGQRKTSIPGRYLPVMELSLRGLRRPGDE